MYKAKRKDKNERTAVARSLRRGQTDAENALWFRLRNRQIDGAKFRRQQPIGQYVVDFICFESKLVVEVDGGGHNKAHMIANDNKRTLWLGERGYRILRFWNDEVLRNPDGVLERIQEALT